MRKTALNAQKVLRRPSRGIFHTLARKQDGVAPRCCLGAICSRFGTQIALALGWASWRLTRVTADEPMLLFDVIITTPRRSRAIFSITCLSPVYGNFLQLLKVEIGGDSEMTNGAEASHERTAIDQNYHRGYEWWSMQQAKARNPDIKLYGLEWSAPGGSTGVSFRRTTSTTSFTGFRIRNPFTVGDRLHRRLERKWILRAWFESLKGALVANNLSTKVVAADAYQNLDVATDLKSDSAFNAAVDIVGIHYPCQNQSTTAEACPSCRTPWRSESRSGLARRAPARSTTAPSPWPARTIATISRQKSRPASTGRSSDSVVRESALRGGRRPALRQSAVVRIVRRPRRGRGEGTVRRRECRPVQFRRDGRAIASDATEGYAEIVADARTDRILGAQIIGRGAGELIAEVVAHMEYGGSAEDLGRTIHAHPTMSEAVKQVGSGVSKSAIHAI